MSATPPSPANLLFVRGKPPPVESVFTPRNPQVNPAMYVPRTRLEDALSRALKSTQHVAIHGESGSGKSWLFKRFQATNRDYHWVEVNLAIAARAGSIVSAILQTLADPSRATKTGYSEGKDAEVGIPGLGAGISHEGQFEYEKEDPFLSAVREIRSRAGKRRAVLVLDNLEQIFDEPDRMRELGSLIVMCDDTRYSSFAVKFLLVGIPAHIREYYSKVPNLRTVSTRLTELPEVAGFTEPQTAELITKGFVAELRMAQGGSLGNVKRHVHFVTLGIPLYVHEYCLELAYSWQDAKGQKHLKDLLEEADSRWLTRSLRQTYGEVDGLMNSGSTRVGRKNQVLYVLGQIKEETFDSPSVEAALKTEFPRSTHGKTLNVGGMLSDIAKNPVRVIRRTSKGDKYLFVDPKFRMCLRTMLRKTANETVVKLEPSEFRERHLS